MNNETEILKERCRLLDFKTAIQGEILEYARLIRKTRKKIAKSNNSILDIDTKLKALESFKNTINS